MSEVSEDEFDYRNIPTFTGYGDGSIITYFEGLEYFMERMTNMNDAQKLELLKVTLRGSARTAFDAAIAIGGDAADGDNDAARYKIRKAWLINRYHTAEFQQNIRDQLSAIFQVQQEDPITFYIRIRRMIEQAGYADAAKDPVAEITFMHGLRKDLAQAISPIALNLQQKIRYAQECYRRQD